MKLSELRRLMREIPIPADVSQQNLRNEYLLKLGLDPNNLYQELEMESRFADTHRDTSFSNAGLHLHSHSFYELLYCRNTCGVEYLVGAERYRLQKGDIVIVPPGVSHRPLLPEHMTQPYMRDVLWLSQEFFTTMEQIVPAGELHRISGTRLLRTAATQWESLGELFHHGVEEAERREVGWELAVMGNTLQLMACLCRTVQDRTARPLRAEKPELLDRILAHIEENLQEKLTLGEVARQFYVSQSTVSQIFREKMGVSFYRCVTQRRLIAAKSFIMEGYALETVAGGVGFSDYSAFYRAFRQEYGISPRQYRNLHDGNA